MIDQSNQRIKFYQRFTAIEIYVERSSIFARLIYEPVYGFFMQLEVGRGIPGIFCIAEWASEVAAVG